MVQYTTIVKASLEKVWQHLILKIEKPENFVPGVSDVIILEKNEDGFFDIRKLCETQYVEKYNSKSSKEKPIAKNDTSISNSAILVDNGAGKAAPVEDTLPF
jgi:ribosome-associated toxin RatA of RatAB toxin-antitoxin module